MNEFDKAREERRKEWAENYLAHSKEFYKELEAKGVNTDASKCKRLPYTLGLILDIQERRAS